MERDTTAFAATLAAAQATNLPPREAFEQAAVDLVATMREMLPPAFTKVTGEIIRDRRDLTLRVNVALELPGATEISVDLDQPLITVRAVLEGITDGLRQFQSDLQAAAADAYQAWERKLGHE